jgi:hypothetical protein
VSGGYISGGWGYVWFAYGWTAFVLLAYGVSLIARLRAGGPHPAFGHPLPPGEGRQGGGEAFGHPLPAGEGPRSGGEGS